MAKLLSKLKEAFFSVLPVITTVIALHFTITPMPLGILVLFLSGGILLLLGMSLFTLGADVAMMPMGEHIGAHLTKTNKIWFLALICLLIGAFITIAEPDLQVLAHQVPSVPNRVLIISVALGVGILLVIAMIRILYRIRLSYLLVSLYIIVFIMAFLTEPDYLPVAFDSGGVTTGPITVPFILALGVGLSAVLGGKSSHDDSFGLVALCSVGPIMAVMVMGLFFDSSSTGFAAEATMKISGLQDIMMLYLHNLPHYFGEVALALSPIIILFIIFQIFALKLSRQQLIKMIIGILYTFIGLVLFLTGVNVGFSTVGNFIGTQLGSLTQNWVLLPLGALLGAFVVIAEPAVHILNNQVEDVSGGAISKKMMMVSLSAGVGLAIVLSMLRILYDVSIWYIILPGYFIALLMTFWAPQIFVAIAFDSGGVASGPMTATFLLPFAMGATEAVGGNLLTDAFGIVAMVAMTPLIAIQILGIIYKIKLKQAEKSESIALQQASEAEGEEKFHWTDGHSDGKSVEWREQNSKPDETNSFIDLED